MSASTGSALTVSLPGTAASVPTPAALAPGRFALGINLSGLEIGPSTLPGTAGVNYAIPTKAELAYYHSQGLDLVRLPILWERLQPTLGGALNATYLGQIQQVVSQAAALGMKIILDAHDNGGYGGHKLGDGTLTDANFADFWGKVATALSGSAGIAGYDLMNEPNNMPSASAWQNAAQAAITAIRAAGDANPIYVEGNNYSGAGNWTASNPGLQNLADPKHDLVFSAHVYMDGDNSGTHMDWASQAALGDTTGIGAQRLGDFVGWLHRYGLNGAVGEVGAADNDPHWLAALDKTLAYAQANGLQTTYWAGGPWWGDYALSAEPGADGQAAPQMAVLDRYTGALPTIAASAPDLAGTAAANAAVTATENGVALGSTTADADGKWSLSLTGLATGLHTVTLAQAGAAAGTPLAAVSFVLQPGGAADGSALVLAGTHDQYAVAADAGSVRLQDLVDNRNGTADLAGGVVMRFLDGIGLADATGNAGRVAHLYQAAFGRAPDLAGVQYWSAAMDAGTATLSDVAGSFVGSAEFQNDYGALNDDRFVGRLYSNVLGRASDAAGSAYWVNQMAQGASRGQALIGFSEGFENIQNTLGTSGDPDRSEAYRLYNAAFDRAPGDAELGYWTTALQGGASIGQIANDFLASPEFAARYGAPSDAGFADALYQNVLGRAADGTGESFWTGQMAAGMSRADVLLGFSDSVENRAATSGATHANWVFLANQG